MWVLLGAYITEVPKRQGGAAVNNIKRVRTLRIISYIGLLATMVIAALSKNINLIGSVLLLPFTCISGIGAYYYSKLERSEKARIQKFSPVGLWTIFFHPYILFGVVLVMNIFFLMGEF